MGYNLWVTGKRRKEGCLTRESLNTTQRWGCLVTRAGAVRGDRQRLRSVRPVYFCVAQFSLAQCSSCLRKCTHAPINVKSAPHVNCSLICQFCWNTCVTSNEYYSRMFMKCIPKMECQTPEYLRESQLTLFALTVKRSRYTAAANRSLLGAPLRISKERNTGYFAKWKVSVVHFTTTRTFLYY